jgi:hypothetical protein|tara:strand:- start:2 stop:127 length:126 start_codon:yes stop_codon:yes gene_type:complete
MIKLLIKNKKLWMPALTIIIVIVLMIVLSKYGFNPLGYVVY